MFNSKKIIGAIGAFTLATALLAAQNKKNGQDESAPMVQRPPEQQITPNAGPRVSNGADVFVTVDFIWWKAHQDGLEYASSGIAFNETQAVLLPITSQGKVYEPTFKFKPGFKVGAGLDLGHDGWDLYLNYTWLVSKKNNTSSFTEASRHARSTWDEIANNAMATISDVPPQFTTETVPPYNFSAQWKLNSFNVLDLELGRNFYISKRLALRPHAGLKGSWQKQRYDLSVTAAEADTALLLIYNINMQQKFSGIGIRGGLDATWYFCNNFSMFSEMSATAMWSRFKDSRFGSRNVPALAASSLNPLTLQNSKYTQDTLTPVFEFAIGLRGETWFYDDNYHFAADLGWEEQIWLSMNNFISNTEHDSHGKLALHGLTLRVRFDF